MVYESDFYTTRRPYRTTPTYSTYTTSDINAPAERGIADPIKIAQRIDRMLDAPGMLVGKLMTEKLHHQLEPSRQIRILPGLGKVHIVHSYDRIVPYVGHKRLTVVTTPPRVWSTTPSVLNRQYDWIENRLRPRVAYSETNRYLNSDSAVRIIYTRSPIREAYYLPSSLYTNYFRIHRPYLWYNWSSNYWPTYNPLRAYMRYWPLYRPLSYYSSYYNTYLPTSSYLLFDDYYRYLKRSIFDDETRLIRAQTNSLLRHIHDPVPRAARNWPITSVRYGYEDINSLPARWRNDSYIHKMLMVSPKSNRAEYMTYYTEPVRKYFGQGHLSCVTYAGDRAQNRRRNVWSYEDPVKNDIQLLSYYIAKFRQDKAIREPSKVPLSASRPSRKFASSKPRDDTQFLEIQQLREQRAARLAKIYADDTPPPSISSDEAVKAKKMKEEAILAEERAQAEENAKKEAAKKKKDEDKRKAEIAQQEMLAAQAAAEKAAELEKEAELARQKKLAKEAQIEKARKLEEEKALAEEQKRLDEERALAEEQRRLEDEERAEEERKQLLRLEELAKQAEEEKEAELARQADELAELARQEAALAEEAKKDEQLAELARQEAELAELERQEAELAELERQEKQLNEAAALKAAAEELAAEQSAAAENDETEATEDIEEAAVVDPVTEETERIEFENERLQDELEELRRQEAELAELDRQEAELAELDRQAAELAAQSSQVNDEEQEAISSPVAEATDEDVVEETQEPTVELAADDEEAVEEEEVEEEEEEEEE